MILQVWVVPLDTLYISVWCDTKWRVTVTGVILKGLTVRGMNSVTMSTEQQPT